MTTLTFHGGPLDGQQRKFDSKATCEIVQHMYEIHAKHGVIRHVWVSSMSDPTNLHYVGWNPRA